MVQASIWLAAMIVAAIASLPRGGVVERRGLILSIGCLGLVLASGALGAMGRPLAIAAELALTLGLAALAWKSPRPWPAPATGFALVLLFVQGLAWLRDLETAWPATLAAIGVLACVAFSAAETKPVA